MSPREADDQTEGPSLRELHDYYELISHSLHTPEGVPSAFGGVGVEVRQDLGKIIVQVRADMLERLQSHLRSVVPGDVLVFSESPPGAFGRTLPRLRSSVPR